MSPATCRSRAWRANLASTATPRRASASRRRRSTTRSTTRSASASCRRSITQSNQYRVILEADPTLAAIARFAGCDLSAVVPSPGQVPLSAIVHVEQKRGPAADQPSRPVPGGDDLLQPAAGRLARRGGRAIRRRRRHRHAGQLVTSFQGAAPAFQASLSQRAAADPGRDRHGLHRAGRALRELHPPDHDPLHAALGRRRRAAGADASPATTWTSSASSASSC